MSESTRSELVSPFAGLGLRLVLLSWFAVLGFDFFLHGGLLARLYANPSPFLLSPLEAFKRIPIGYLSFLLLSGFLVWISPRLGIQGWKAGLRFGGLLGLVIWSSLALGLYSISSAPPGLLAAWTLGQTVEMAYGGAVIGYGLEHRALKRSFVGVLLATLGFVVLTIVTQALGLAPAVIAG